MRHRLTAMLILFLVGSVGQAASSAEPTKDKKTTDDRAAQAAKEALRLKATKNIESIVARIDLSSSQRAKVKALLRQSQWDAVVSTFKTARESEIHDHAHKIVQKTIPGIMQKFMPAYMSSKISAQRRKQGRRGPPSRAEIAKIQKDAQSKMQPAMRKTVMPALDKLTAARLAEMLEDEKVLTRMLADRIIKGNLLGDAETKEFQSALDNAGFSATLTSGFDAVLNDRTEKMLKAIDLKEVVKRAGL